MKVINVLQFLLLIIVLGILESAGFAAQAPRQAPARTYHKSVIKNDALKLQPARQIKLENIPAYPSSWDWRNVHGENWITSVRDQYSDNCWAYAEVGALEAQINLYFNQHLDLDLSERYLTDCILKDKQPTGMSPDLFSACKCDTHLSGREFCAIAHHGIVDEGCNPTPNPDLGEDTSNICKTENNGGPICNDYSVRVWRNSAYKDYVTINYKYKIPACSSNVSSNLTENDLKALIITSGPLSAVVQNENGSHNMLLIGYKQTDGETIWIFKNSHGIDEDDEGYSYEPFKKIGAVALPIGPFIPPKSQSYWPIGFMNQIQCVDNDNDGYCNWSISKNKPSTCPEKCNPLKDCNDADPGIGPFISPINLNCRKLK